MLIYIILVFENLAGVTKGLCKILEII